MGFNPELGAFGRRNLSHFCHKVTVSTSGTIVSQDAPADSGVIASKVAATNGRYLLTLPEKYRTFCGGFATILGPDTAVLGAKTTGSLDFFRVNKIDANTPDGTVLLQFANPSTDATNYIDAELATNSVFFVHIWVEV